MKQIKEKSISYVLSKKKCKISFNTI